jgi:hypothetical protein
MPNPQINILVDSGDPQDREVYLDDLRDLSSRLLACLNATEQSLTNAPPKLKHHLLEVEKHSIGVVLDRPKDAAKGALWRKTASLFNKTTKAIQQGKPVDPRLTFEALEAYKEFANRFLRKTRRLVVGGVSITTEFIANIDKILSGIATSQGSVKGRVERLNIHKRNEFALYSPLSDQGIVCSFDNEHFDKVREAIGRNVTVTGTLHFYGVSPLPVRVTAKIIDIHPPDDELPTLASLKGILPDAATGGLSAVDFISMVRNGQK